MVRVNVYTHERTDAFGKPLACPPLVLAYTRYQGEGACVHEVHGTDNGAEAKRLAIAAHRRTCLRGKRGGVAAGDGGAAPKT